MNAHEIIQQAIQALTTDCDWKTRHKAAEQLKKLDPWNGFNPEEDWPQLCPQCNCIHKSDPVK